MSMKTNPILPQQMRSGALKPLFTKMMVPRPPKLKEGFKMKSLIDVLASEVLPEEGQAGRDTQSTSMGGTRGP